MKNIAKLTSYGVYLDCPFITAPYPNEEEHIVGDVADYVYDLEQKINNGELIEPDSYRMRFSKVFDAYVIDYVTTNVVAVYKDKEQAEKKLSELLGE